MPTHGLQNIPQSIPVSTRGGPGSRILPRSREGRIGALWCGQTGSKKTDGLKRRHWLLCRGQEREQNLMEEERLRDLEESLEGRRRCERRMHREATGCLRLWGRRATGVSSGCWQTCANKMCGCRARRYTNPCISNHLQTVPCHSQTTMGIELALSFSVHDGGVRRVR